LSQLSGNELEAQEFEPPLFLYMNQGMRYAMQHPMRDLGQFQILIEKTP